MSIEQLREQLQTIIRFRIENDKMEKDLNPFGLENRLKEIVKRVCEEHENALRLLIEWMEK